MLHATVSILAKDLRLRLRDRSVYLFAFVVPLALTLVFSFIFPADDEFRLRAALVDEDGGPVAEGFAAVVDRLAGEGLVEPVAVEGRDEAVAKLRDGTLDAAWVVPDGFSSSVSAGDGGELEVLTSSGRALAAEVAQAIAQGYGTQVDRIALSVATAITATRGAADVDAVIAAASASAPIASLEPLVAPDAQLDATSYLAAGMAVFFLFFVVQYGVTGLLEERDQHTLTRLRAAPIPPAAIPVGKAAGAFLVGVTSMTVLAVANALVLDARWGPTTGVAVLVLSAVLAAIGLMALVGTFARTSEQAGNFQSIAALVFGLTGGVFFPVGTGVLADLSLVSPHGWFLRGLGDLVGAGTWTAALPAAGALGAFGLVTAMLAGLRMRATT